MSALLTVLRFADSLHVSEDPLLGRYYNETEYAKAKPRLDEILRNSGIKIAWPEPSDADDVLSHGDVGIQGAGAARGGPQL